MAAFRLSDATNQRAELLVQREKGGELTANEKSELDHYLELEHIMRLAKARTGGSANGQVTRSVGL